MFDEPSLIFVFCFLFPPSLPLSSVIRCIIQECVRICTQNSFEIESTAPFSEAISKYKFCKSCIILTLNETARDCLKKKKRCYVFVHKQLLSSSSWFLPPTHHNPRDSCQSRSWMIVRCCNGELFLGKGTFGMCPLKRDLFFSLMGEKILQVKQNYSLDAKGFSSSIHCD